MAEATDNTYTLLDAVDDLTLEHKRWERQDIVRDGRVIGQQRVHVTLPPLLTQLADAIRANMGGNSAGASLSSERNLLDADALYKLILIDAQIRDWCRGMKLTPGKDPAENLRAWYTAQLAHVHAPEVDAYHVKQLGKWAAQIRYKLDPHRERELPDACPTCGASSWWRDGAEYFRPLVIRYKPSSGPDMVQEARGICRACEASWQVRELAYELEQKQSEGAAWSELEGATTAPQPGVEIANAGEFAARWNSVTPQRREQSVKDIQRAFRESFRCFTEDHDGRIQQSSNAS